MVTDCFGGVHRAGVKFLKDSGARLRGRDGAGNDPAVPLVVDPTSEDECDSSDSSRSSGPTANPFFSLSMQSISLAAHKALAAHVFRVRRSSDAATSRDPVMASHDPEPIFAIVDANGDVGEEGDVGAGEGDGSG